MSESSATDLTSELGLEDRFLKYLVKNLRRNGNELYEMCNKTRNIQAAEDALKLCQNLAYDFCSLTERIRSDEQQPPSRRAVKTKSKTEVQEEPDRVSGSRLNAATPPFYPSCPDPEDSSRNVVLEPSYSGNTGGVYNVSESGTIRCAEHTAPRNVDQPSAVYQSVPTYPPVPPYPYYLNTNFVYQCSGIPQMSYSTPYYRRDCYQYPTRTQECPGVSDSYYSINPVKSAAPHVQASHGNTTRLPCPPNSPVRPASSAPGKTSLAVTNPVNLSTPKSEPSKVIKNVLPSAKTESTVLPPKENTSVGPTKLNNSTDTDLPIKLPDQVLATIESPKKINNNDVTSTKPSSDQLVPVCDDERLKEFPNLGKDKTLSLKKSKRKYRRLNFSNFNKKTTYSMEEFKLTPMVLSTLELPTLFEEASKVETTPENIKPSNIDRRPPPKAVPPAQTKPTVTPAWNKGDKARQNKQHPESATEEKKHEVSELVFWNKSTKQDIKHLMERSVVRKKMKKTTNEDGWTEVTYKKEIVINESSSTPTPLNIEENKTTQVGNQGSSRPRRNERNIPVSSSKLAQPFKKLNEEKAFLNLQKEEDTPALLSGETTTNISSSCISEPHSKKEAAPLTEIPKLRRWEKEIPLPREIVSTIDQEAASLHVEKDSSDCVDQEAVTSPNQDENLAEILDQEAATSPNPENSLAEVSDQESALPDSENNAAATYSSQENILAPEEELAVGSSPVKVIQAENIDANVPESQSPTKQLDLTPVGVVSPGSPVHEPIDQQIEKKKSWADIVEEEELEFVRSAALTSAVAIEETTLGQPAMLSLFSSTPSYPSSVSDEKCICCLVGEETESLELEPTMPLSPISQNTLLDKDRSQNEDSATDFDIEDSVGSKSDELVRYLDYISSDLDENYGMDAFHLAISIWNNEGGAKEQYETKFSQEFIEGVSRHLKQIKDNQLKHQQAAEKRQQLLETKTAKVRGFVQKVEDVKAAQHKLELERKTQLSKYDEKMKKADINRKKYLINIKKKAHDEEEKLKEIAFINELEAQNRRHDSLALRQEHEERRQGIIEERQRRIEENAAKEAAAEERRRAIEAERLEKLQLLTEKRKKKEEIIGKKQQEKEQERLEIAREKAREREERLQARNAAQIANAEELQKRIKQKQEESARRHEENIELKRQKALEVGLHRTFEESSGKNEEQAKSELNAPVPTSTRPVKAQARKKFKKLTARIDLRAKVYMITHFGEDYERTSPIHNYNDSLESFFSQLESVHSVVYKGLMEPYIFRESRQYEIVNRVFELLLNLNVEHPRSLHVKCADKIWKIYSSVISKGEEVEHFVQSKSIIPLIDFTLHIISLPPTTIPIKWFNHIGRFMTLISFVVSSLGDSCRSADRTKIDEPKKMMFIDTISYMVHIGMINKIMDLFKFSLTNDKFIPTTEACFAFYRSMIKSKFEIPALMEFLQKTDFLGLVVLLYEHVQKISVDTVLVDFIYPAVEILIDFSNVNLKVFQKILGAEGMALQVRGICRTLIVFCMANKSIPRSLSLFSSVVRLVGLFAKNNRNHQDLIQSGMQPTILQMLVSLPVEYFCNIDYAASVIPTIDTLCKNNPTNDAIAHQQLSLQVKDRFEALLSPP